MIPHFVRIIGSVLVLWLLPLQAVAQDTSQEQRARRLFKEAQTALNTGRFAEARDLLQRSLKHAPNAGSAFNLAVALRGTGQVLQAVGKLEKLLQGEYGPLKGPQRREAKVLLREIRAEVAVLHITATGAEEIDIRIDGEHVGTVAEGERIRHRVNPGPRLVTASAPDHHTAEARVELERGGSRQLSLELEPTAEARLGTLVVQAASPDDVLEIVGVARGTRRLEKQLDPGEYEVQASGPSGNRSTTVDLEAGEHIRLRLDSDSDALVRSPWLWTGVGLAVSGLAAGAAVLFTERAEDPVSDPTYGVVETLRAR
jgi:hypothetical protein